MTEFHPLTPSGREAVSFQDAQIGDVQVGQAAQTINNYYLGAAPAAAQAAADRFVDGLTALRRLILHSPAVRDTVVIFNDRFTVARAQVRELINLKELHDLLHNLQYRDLRLLVLNLARFPEDDLTRPSIEQSESQLRDAVQCVEIMVASGSFTTSEVAWSVQLGHSADQIRAGLAGDDRAVIAQAARRARSITSTRLSFINTSLYNKAGSLRPDELAASLNQLQRRLADLAVDEGELARVASGIAGLTELLRHLSGLVIVHNAWQEFENELRRVEDSLRTDTLDLELSWPDMRQRTMELAVGDERWAVELRLRCERLDQALAATQRSQLADLFDRFQSEAGRRFHQIDLGLKQLCNRLDSFREPLNALEAALR